MLEDYLCLVLGSLSILTSNDSWVTNDSKKRTKALREAAQCKDKRVVFRRRKKQQLVSQFPPQLSSEKVCCGKRAARLCQLQRSLPLTADSVDVGHVFLGSLDDPLSMLWIFFTVRTSSRFWFIVVVHCPICLLNCVRDIHGRTLVH